MELNPIPASASAPKNPEAEEGPRISCCYGVMVFLGLTFSLVALTMLVIYAGVWSQMSLYGNVKPRQASFFCENKTDFGSRNQCTML